jgi:serine/threonine protein kinase
LRFLGKYQLVRPFSQSSQVQPGEIPTTTELQTPHEELKIKGFEIIEELGSGGMSSVYKAEQVLMGRTVAVKVLHRFLLSDQSQLQRFLQEARFAKGLEHPNIAHVYSFGTTDDGRPFMVMEFCEGQTLQHLIANKQLKWAEITKIIEQICAGLAHAHHKGITHRDLKPSNIFLVTMPGGGLQVKIIDFGIAKLSVEDEETAQKLTRTGMVMGTPYYMSPEQCSGEKVDNRSDLYALGCIVYEILCGQPPFLGESTLDIARKQVTEAPLPVSEVGKQKVDPALEALVMKAIAKSRDERFQSAEEFAEALQLIGAARGTDGKVSSGASGIHSSLASEPKSPVSVKSIFIGVALSAVLVCAAGAAYFFGHKAQQHSPAFLAAHAEFNAGNYETAGPKLLELRGTQLGEDDANALLSDLIDLGVMVAQDRPTPQQMPLPHLNTKDVNQAILYVGGVLLEPPSNNPSRFLIYKAQLEAADMDGSFYEHVAPSFKVENVNDQDRAYLNGMKSLIDATMAQYRGRDDEALPCLADGVRSLRSSGRASRLALGMFRYSSMQTSTGNVAGGQESQNQWFALLPQVMKENERETAEALIQLAQYKIGSQHLDEGAQILARAGEIYKQKRGGHFAMAAYYSTLSALEVHKQNKAAAIAYIKQALPEYQAVPNHPDYLVGAYNQLAQLSFAQKEYPEAARYAQLALRSIRNVPVLWKDARESETVDALSTYALILAAQNDKTAELSVRNQLAELLLVREQKALAAMRAAPKGTYLPAAQYHTLSFQRMVNLLSMGKHADVAKLADERIKLIADYIGDSRLLADTTLQKSWSVLDSKQRLSALEDAVRIMERTAKTDVEKAYVVELHACLGCAYEMLNRFVEAIPLLEDAEKFCSKPGISRVNWELTSPYSLANAYFASGKTKEASEIYKKWMPKLKPDERKNDPIINRARANWQKLNLS